MKTGGKGLFGRMTLASQGYDMTVEQETMSLRDGLYSRIVGPGKNHDLGITIEMWDWEQEHMAPVLTGDEVLLSVDAGLYSIDVHHLLRCNSCVLFVCLSTRWR